MKLLVILGSVIVVAMLVGCVSGRQPAAPAAGGPQDQAISDVPSEAGPPLPQYKIVTLLPPDAIPAIDNPKFLSAEEADGAYQPDEPVLGVEIDGDARAYSIPHLSGHEIVNDIVGGVPIAVTW